NVHPSVVIVIEKGAAGAGGFGQVVLSRFTARVCPGNATGFRRNDLEQVFLNRRSEGSGRKIGQREPGRYGTQKFPTGKIAASTHSVSLHRGNTSLLGRALGLRLLSVPGLPTLDHLTMDRKLPLALLFSPGSRVGDGQIVMSRRILRLELHRSFER